MADWKKLVVSGSNISQLNNDSAYLTAATAGKAFASASYNGTSLLADSSAGNLVFASGSGQGLIISASAGNDTLTFGLSAIPNSSLANSGSIIGSTPVALGATVSSIAGLTLTGVQASGSFSGSFQGDGSLLTGIASNLAISGSTGNGSVALKTQALSIVGTSLEVETSVSGQTVTIGLPNDVTIGNNLTVTGDLVVNGNTTTLNTTNIVVEDKFVLLASGSASSTDGGIIVQSSTSGTGYALGWDANTARWSLQAALAQNATAITPDAYVTVTEFGLSGNKPTNPTYGGATNGLGNIWVSSDTSEIYIWA
jgi:hypothetical protein